MRDENVALCLEPALGANETRDKQNHHYEGEEVEASKRNRRVTRYCPGFREAGWEHPPPGWDFQRCPAVFTVFILS